MAEQIKYDVAIVGGGLAGLSLSIQLAKLGHSVILFEKEQYPFHKVCGEYISMESWDFIQQLGVDLPSLNVSRISKLQVSSGNGKSIEQSLPLGGFGISRYLLDNELVKLARKLDVVVKEDTKVNDITFNKNSFDIDAGLLYQAKFVAGSYGKRSNIDIKWKRPFTTAAKNKLNNYVGVKYQIEIDFPVDTIALHNFKDGYCGIVKVEDNKYCLCYLTTAANLQNNKGQIKEMEKNVLCKNPYLHEIFDKSHSLYDSPLTISQISFDKKSQIENHVMMIGDAAGMITPLCGNGMSMALHGSKLAAGIVHEFLLDKITRSAMEEVYAQLWKKQFSKRIRAGRRIQRLFGSNRLTGLFIRIVKPFPGFINFLIKQTHGRPF